jgi:hypothetical protein
MKSEIDNSHNNRKIAITAALLCGMLAVKTWQCSARQDTPKAEPPKPTPKAEATGSATATASASASQTVIVRIKKTKPKTTQPQPTAGKSVEAEPEEEEIQIEVTQQASVSSSTAAVASASAEAASPTPTPAQAHNQNDLTDSTRWGIGAGLVEGTVFVDYQVIRQTVLGQELSLDIEANHRQVGAGVALTVWRSGFVEAGASVPYESPTTPRPYLAAGFRLRL